MFESYWPNVGADPNAPKEARIIAKELDEMTKVGFFQNPERNDLGEFQAGYGQPR